MGQIARVENACEWSNSPYPIKGAGAGRLDFDKQYIVEALVASRKLVINKETGLTVGEEIAKNVAGIMNLKDGDVVADLGCGPGLIAKHLLPTLGTGKLYCLDASEAMLGQAVKSVRETKGTMTVDNVTFMHGDIHTVDKLIPEAVDGILLSGNVHLLTNRLMAFKAMRRLLKPTGKLVVVCHAYFYGPESHNHFAALVDQKREDRPELMVDGLRLPMMSARELREVMGMLGKAGLNVQAHENDTFAPDVDWVFGWPPQMTIMKRLEVLVPGMAETQRSQMALGVLDSVASGRPAQVYLQCSPKEHSFRLAKG